MEPASALNLAMLAGEIMLKNGAETYRVEDTITRILDNCGYTPSESFVTTTGIFASIKTAEGPATLLKRVTNRTTNFEKLIAVNNVSRLFADKEISSGQAMESLEKIEDLPQFSSAVKVFASAVCCLCFAYIFGGQLLDCANAFFTGMILQSVLNHLHTKNIAGVLVNIIGGTIVSFFSLIFINCGLGVELDMVIIGSIMPLVPGIGLTNAIRDILEGDYLSGTSRITEAVIIAVGIATGVGGVLQAWIYFFGGIII